eukprot:scaffold106577_cov65-Phaeocystis_antarctica.AAC.2
MADPNYKPPKIPKPAAARARIYEGIAKNELLSQCARPPLPQPHAPRDHRARACVHRSLSDAQKEVIVNGVIEVPTSAGDAVINEVWLLASVAPLSALPPL